MELCPYLLAYCRTAMKTKDPMMTSLVQSARHEHHRDQRATRTIHHEHRQGIAQMARVSVASGGPGGSRVST